MVIFLFEKDEKNRSGNVYTQNAYVVKCKKYDIMIELWKVTKINWKGGYDVPIQAELLPISL